MLWLINPLLKNEGIIITNNINFNRWLMIDALQIEQALINLLTNSLYALQNTGTKHIEISAEIKNDRLFILISDSGPGIDKAIEDKIFLPFFTTRNDGAGIGLTLSRNIIEAMAATLIISYRIIKLYLPYAFCNNKISNNEKKKFISHLN